MERKHERTVRKGEEIGRQRERVRIGIKNVKS